jgi:hypothetical protein
MRLSTLLPFTVFALLASLSCKDDKKPTDTSTPPPDTATLENIWPNADSLSWTYRITQRTQLKLTMPVRTYSTGDSCPPAPTMVELQARMGSHAFGDSFTVSSGSYRLQFSGQGTTQSGMLGQNLTHEIIPDTAAFPSRRDTGSGSSFWSQLWVARPDLRPALKARGVQIGGPDAPLFLQGGIWEKNQEAIVKYGDLDSLVNWTYLRKNLAPGAQFTHQLAPRLADDLYLHALMLSTRTVDLGGGRTVSALGCLYMVDFGVATATDEHGHDLGHFRMFSYGTIYYATNLGPVLSEERGEVETGPVWTPGMIDATARLTDGGPAY